MLQVLSTKGALTLVLPIPPRGSVWMLQVLSTDNRSFLFGATRDYG